MVSESEIIGFEKKYWKAMGDKDVGAAISLTYFPCLISGPQGTRRVSEDEYRRLMEAHPMEDFKDIEIQNPKVDVINEKTAFITYTVEINNKKMQNVSTWIKEAEKWECVFHSEIPVQ